MVAEIILCLLLLILAWSWILYPLLMVLVSRGTSKPADSPGYLPEVVILISAHNEETHIEARLKNLLGQDYKGAISIRLGVDGGSDGTGQIAQEFAKTNPGIQVREFAERKGKTAVLKELASGIGGDAILVFTDANTSFHADAIRLLVCRLGDKGIGGVCGRLVLKDKSGLPTPESSYWNLENRLKLAESNMDSCLGANGAIYAIRRNLFPAILPDDTIIDDFVIGMKVREQGHKFVYEPDAVAEEDLPEIRHEWARRVRIGSGDLQALWLCRRCLSPVYGSFALMFWSHKVLRWLTPVLSIVVLAVAMTDLLIAPVLYAPDVITLAAAAVILFAAVLHRLGLPFGLFAVCDHFVTMQCALLCGYFKFLTGRTRGHWQRTPR